MIPSGLYGDSSRLPSDAGRAHPRPWLRAHGRAGPPSRPDTGDVSVSGLAGIIKAALRRRAGASAPPRVHTLGLRVHEDAGPPSRPDTGDVSVSGLAGIIHQIRNSHIAIHSDTDGFISRLSPALLPLLQALIKNEWFFQSFLTQECSIGLTWRRWRPAPCARR